MAWDIGYLWASTLLFAAKLAREFRLTLEWRNTIVVTATAPKD
jgi:hypothetical protein